MRLARIRRIHTNRLCRFTPLSEWPTCTSVFFRGNLGFERIAKALSVLGGATEAWEAAAAALEDVSVAEDARGLGGKSG